MSQTKNPKRNAREVAESRRVLAVETLTSAMRKDRCSMRVALGVLEGSKIFSTEEVHIARRCVQEIDRIDEQLHALFASDTRVFGLQLHARSLVDEVAVLRECAFWLLGAGGMLTVEKIISRLMSVYSEVRVLLRILLAKDMDTLPGNDPAPLPEIPHNRYFPITHPELVA